MLLLLSFSACDTPEAPFVPEPYGLDPVDGPTEIGAPRGLATLQLSLDSSLERGETSRFTVRGGDPGETIALIYGTAGLGVGPCPPVLGGLCVDIRNPLPIRTAVVNNQGIATFVMPVPVNAPLGATLFSQVAVARGPGGASSVKSHVRADSIEPIDRTAPTGGSAVAVTQDGLVSVNANRTAGEITTMAIDLIPAVPTGTIDATIATPEAEPWSVVVGEDDDTAFVVLRAAGQVVRLSDLHAGAVESGRATVGGEPVGIAIDPSGDHLYVTDHTAGLVHVIDTQSMAVTATVDLNAALQASGLLGPSVAAARPGLARPWAVVVTDDGDEDDDDEQVYVTEFYSQDDPTKTFGALGDAYFDEGRQGIVYRFDVATRTLGPVISLGSVASTGFNDSLGQATGCFPNQLATAALDNGRLYITSTCASPRGPAAGGGVNSKTKVHALMSVVDTATNFELPAERLVLTKQFETMYGTRGTPDDSSRRYPLLPNSMSFVPGTHIAYLTAYGSDGLFRVEWNANGTLREVGSVFAPFINLSAGAPAGRLPIGVATTDNGDAVVLNENTRNASFINLGTQSVSATLPAATAVTPGAETEANEGRRFFVTGLGRWSLNGQGWNSCEGCHPSGLSDNVTWYFAAGPRQSTSLDGSFAPDGTQRVFNWTAIIDEVGDFENNTRGISGGVGALVHNTAAPINNGQRIIFDGTHPAGSTSTDVSQVNLFGSVGELLAGGVAGTDGTGVPITITTTLQDWARIEAWMRTIRAPNPPTFPATDIANGRNVFVGAGCAGCHGGENWTISERFYTPSQPTNGAGGLLDATTYALGNLPASLNPPASAGPAPLRAGGTIQCVLRAVGTFGVAPGGVTVSERKEDMVSVAGGATGYNPPSLVGVGAGAPYFHAGNARTLEELLSVTFESHYRGLSAVFTPTPNQVRQLVAYLSSIDDTTAVEGTNVGLINTVLCPPTLP